MGKSVPNQNSDRSRTIYTPDHPPLSQEEARTRINELLASIIKIRTSLQNKHFHDFDGDENAFLNWRQRAKDAIAYKKIESAFLHNWLKEEAGDNGFSEESKLLLAAIQKKCEEFPKEFPVIFTRDAQPQSYEQAAARCAKLTLQLQQHAEWFKETSDKAKSAQIGADRLIPARRTATDHIARLQQEISFVKKWLTHHHSKPVLKDKSERKIIVDRTYHSRTLLAVIERALARGMNLELTEEEQTSLNFFRAKNIQRASSLQNHEPESPADKI